MTFDEFVNKLRINPEEVQKLQGLTGALEAFSNALEGNPGRELVEAALESRGRHCIALISRLIPGITREEIETLVAQLGDSKQPFTHTSIVFTLSQLLNRQFPNQ
jgi:hypothetical protein